MVFGLRSEGVSRSMHGVEGVESETWSFPLILSYLFKGKRYQLMRGNWGFTGAKWAVWIETSNSVIILFEKTAYQPFWVNLLTTISWALRFKCLTGPIWWIFAVYCNDLNLGCQTIADCTHAPMDSLKVGSSRVCRTYTLLTADPANTGSSLRVELRLAPCVFVLGPGWRGSNCCKGCDCNNQKARLRDGVLPLSTSKAHLCYIF